jgi:predicted peptidase
MRLRKLGIPILGLAATAGLILLSVNRLGQYQLRIIDGRLVYAAAAAVEPPSKVDGFEARLYSNETGRTMPYRLFIPEGYDKRKAYPLVLWLHGAGGRGADNLKQISGDQIPGTRVWIKSKNQAQHPTFVLVPQSQTGWGVLPKDNAMSPELLMVPEILNVVMKEFAIDSQRIYIAGQSNGGWGTWALITRNPRFFAAAIIVCGVQTFPDQADRVVDLPIWAFHGTEDPSIRAARQMIAAIQKAGGNPRYTEYQGAGHEIWDRVFQEPMLIDWLFAQSKAG